MVRRVAAIAVLVLVLPSAVAPDPALPPGPPPLEALGTLIRQVTRAAPVPPAPAPSPVVEAVHALAEASGRYVVRCPTAGGQPLLQTTFHTIEGDQIVGMVWEPEGVIDVYSGYEVSQLHHWWTDERGQTWCELVQPEAWTVPVRVVDLEGRPVAGAKAFGNGPPAMTDEDGRAEVEVLALEGQRTWLTAASGDLSAFDVEVDVPGGEVTLILEPQDLQLSIEELRASYEQQRAEVRGALLAGTLSDEAAERLLAWDDVLSLKASGLPRAP